MNKAELIERLEWHAGHQRDCHRSAEAAGWQGAAQVVRNCLDGDPPVDVQRELGAALRQYRHNDGSSGFVFAYETEAINRLIERLTRKPVQIWRYTGNQPTDNLDAYCIGKACNEAARDPKCGDYIDRGLILLKALEEQGYGICPIK